MRNFRHVSQFILVDNFVASSSPHAYRQDVGELPNRWFSLIKLTSSKHNNHSGKKLKSHSLSPCWLGRFFGLNIDFTFFLLLSKRGQSFGAFWRIMQSSLKSGLYKWACGISVNSFTWLKGHYGKMTSRTESHLRKKCISFFCHSNYSVFFNICTHTHSICSFTDISIISCHLKCWFTP